VADESQVFGIGAEAAQVAKVAAAGGFGAWVLVYLRHPGSLLRAVFLVSIGVGIASIFADPLSDWIGLKEVQAAALLGLVGKGIAEGVLKAIEKVDFAQWVFGRKS
jgi:hypothetical protein